MDTVKKNWRGEPLSARHTARRAQHAVAELTNGNISDPQCSSHIMLVDRPLICPRTIVGVRKLE